MKNKTLLFSSVVLLAPTLSTSAEEVMTKPNDEKGIEAVQAKEDKVVDTAAKKKVAILAEKADKKVEVSKEVVEKKDVARPTQKEVKEEAPVVKEEDSKDVVAKEDIVKEEVKTEVAKPEKVVETTKPEATEVTTKVVTTKQEAVKKVFTSKKEKIEADGSVSLDVFTDKEFRGYMSTYDINRDKKLSKEEIEKIERIAALMKVNDVTGIKYLTSLKKLTVSASPMTYLDLSGMTSLEYMTFTSNKNLKTIDIRNCTSLEYVYNFGEKQTVYLSPGMLNYKGSDLFTKTTGNFVIDLDGFYKLDKAGNKIVDMRKVISKELLEVFMKNEQPGFNKATKQLTIPAGADISKYVAGEDSKGSPSEWTFITKNTAPEEKPAPEEKSTLEEKPTGKPVTKVTQVKTTPKLTFTSNKVNNAQVKKASVVPTQLPKTGEDNSSTIVTIFAGSILATFGSIILRKKH